VCVHKWSLSFRYSHQEHIFCHSNTFHMHCPSHSSGCRSVPSSVSVSLETVAYILVVLVAGNLLALLLYVIERCVLADRQTYSSPGHLDTSDSHFVNKENLRNTNVPLHSSSQSILILKEHSTHCSLGTAYSIHDLSSFMLYHKKNRKRSSYTPTVCVTPCHVFLN